MAIKIIQEIYTAFKAKDLSTIMQLQAENAEWSVAGPPDKIPWAAPRYGPEGAAEFLKILGGLLVAELFEIHDYLQKDGKVIAIGFQKGYVRPTNERYEFDFIHLWEVKEDKVTRFRVYYDTAYVCDVLSRVK